MHETGSAGVRHLTADDVGLRRTRQRSAILRALADCTAFVSARQLHARLTAAGEPIGLTTVYRALHDLEHAGLVDVRLDAPTARHYRQRPPTGRRHYLTCRRCGESHVLDTSVVDRWTAHMADLSGFTDIEHTLEICGVCTACAGAVPRH